MLLTTHEMAQRLKTCDTTVKRMFKDGRIPQEFVTKIGVQYRWNGEAIEKHLLKTYVAPPSKL